MAAVPIRRAQMDSAVQAASDDASGIRFLLLAPDPPRGLDSERLIKQLRVEPRKSQLTELGKRKRQALQHSRSAQARVWGFLSAREWGSFAHASLAKSPARGEGTLFVLSHEPYLHAPAARTKRPGREHRHVQALGRPRMR